jgi:hypothetical protein
MDCGTALVLQSSLPVTDTVTAYDTVSTTLTYASGWTDIFTTIGESKGCPVTSCELRDATCTDTIPAVNSNFWITSTGTPWALYAKRDNANGWDAITFCYRCLGTA